MFLNEPARTDYDFSFSILGFDVRVSPWFFVLPVLFAKNMTPADVNMGVGILLTIVIFFISILVHELGHALAFRRFGMPSYIVLYWMGGLAIPGAGGLWGGRPSRSLRSNEQIIVSVAGPVAGFLLAAVLVAFVYLIGGKVGFFRMFDLIPVPYPILKDTALAGVAPARMIISSGIILNIFLNLLNLMPVYPLDGGQIAREYFMQSDPRNGFRNSVILSVGVSVLIAVFAFTNKETFMAIFFGFMAWNNYQLLNSFNRPGW